MRLVALEGLPEITPGMDIAAMIATACAEHAVKPLEIVVVAHKVVSKAEGQVVRLADVVPGADARRLAAETGKDPRLCELILRESRRIVRRRGGTLICETHHGFVCANAGIDQSNVADGAVVLLPKDPDRSARRIAARVAEAVGGRVGVVITDTHGRAFRRGIVNIAIGVAAFRPIVDHRGRRDREGRMLVATEQALADELAAAAGILMDKGGGLPVVIVSGVDTEWGPGEARDMIRDPAHDLFRGAPADGNPS